MNRSKISVIAAPILAAWALISLAAPANAEEIALEAMLLSDISSCRGVCLVLQNPEGPQLAIRCERGELNVRLSAISNHDPQSWTVADFYCQSSRSAFRNLEIGQTLDVKLDVAADGGLKEMLLYVEGEDEPRSLRPDGGR